MGIDVWVSRTSPPVVSESFPEMSKESSNELIPLMVRQAHHERNQSLTVRPELVEGLNQAGSNSQDDWVDLETEVAACTKCELCQTRIQTVFGTGNKNADWMIIGEAPGQNEDEQGKPFVGKAGQLLTEMLRAVGLARDEVFITNILKCRPPNNRDPKPEEAERCGAYLSQQIALIRPKLILSVGRISAQTLLKTDAPVGKLRGKVHNLDGTPLVVVYHPAYLLRSPLEKRKAWQDLLLALQTINKN